MRISMLQTTPGSIDGIRVASYEADTEYDLTATAGERDLASAFVGAGLAVDLDARPAEKPAPPAADEVPAPVTDEVPPPAPDDAPAEPAEKPARGKK